MKILHKHTDGIIFEAEASSIKELVEKALNKGTSLEEADLKGANLRRANLRRANLEGANLSGADLEGADLRGANLVEANLRGADLVEANLWKADLRGANLVEANLRGADLVEANLWKADLWRAKGITKQMIEKVSFIDNYTLSTITYVKYYPNTSLFRRLYPDGRIVNSKFIEV